MARGIIPRQPTKTGRHEGARRMQIIGGAAGAPARPTKQSRAERPIKKASPGPAKPSHQQATKSYNPTSPERVNAILGHLDAMYPDVTCALHHGNAWELLVATILSAQSTDVNVNRVTPALFKKYPTVQHFAALHPEELEPDVRSTGFFRNKSKSVVGAARKI